LRFRFINAKGRTLIPANVLPISVDQRESGSFFSGSSEVCVWGLWKKKYKIERRGFFHRVISTDAIPFMADLQIPIINPPRNDVRQTRNFVLGLYAMTIAWGARQIVCPENGAVWLAMALAFSLLATRWLVCDAKIHGIVIVPVLQMLYFFLWPIGIVIYLFARSGVRGVIPAVVHGVGLTAVYVASFYAIFYGLHFAGLLDSRYYR
jgi:hypothetical protein